MRVFLLLQNEVEYFIAEMYSFDEYKVGLEESKDSTITVEPHVGLQDDPCTDSTPNEEERSNGESNNEESNDEDNVTDKTYKI